MNNKFEEIKVLDKGYVRLIDHMGDDLAPLRAARMSTDNPTGEDESKDDKLRNYLWSKDHSSVFEMAEMVVEMKLPLFILRQLDRHRTLEYPAESVDTVSRKYMSRNEFSGRYSVMPDEFYIPHPDRIRGKGVVNKQSSEGELPEHVRMSVVRGINDASEHAYHNYIEMLAAGVSNEIARMMLPMNIYTKIQLKGCLLSWLKMLSKRLPPDAQWEVREYAKAISTYVRALWPKSWDVFENNTLHGSMITARERLAMWEAVNSMPDTFNFRDALMEMLPRGQADNLLQKLSSL